MCPPQTIDRGAITLQCTVRIGDEDRQRDQNCYASQVFIRTDSMDPQVTTDRIISGSIAEHKRLGYVTTSDRLLPRMQTRKHDGDTVRIVDLHS